VKSQGLIDMDQWCFDAFLSRRVLEEAIRIRQQLLPVIKAALKGPTRVKDFGSKDYDIAIRKALARSFFHHAAFHDRKSYDNDIYVTVHDNHPAGIHPNSGLTAINHEWIIYDSFVYTGKQYMQTVTAVDPDWLIVRRPIHCSPCITTNSS